MEGINDIDRTGKTVLKEINLKDLYHVIKKRFWIVIVMVIITTISGYFMGKMTPKTLVYQASTRVIIRAPLHVNSPDMNTLLVMVTDPAILGDVIQELHLNESVNSLANHISVSDINKSAILNITVIDPSEQRAVNIANTTAKVFKLQMARILNFNGVQLLSGPKSAIPIVTQPKSRVTLGFIVGIVLGIGLVFFIESLDDSIKTDRDIELLLGIPVLGRVSKMSKKNIKTKRFKPIEIKIRGESIGSK